MLLQKRTYVIINTYVCYHINARSRSTFYQNLKPRVAII